MRNTAPLMIAAALLVAGPAAAQDNNVAPAANEASTADTIDSSDAMANAPMNELTTAPPPAADPLATDPAMTVPAEQEDDGGFPWGLLGLLGLIGLIPRNRNRT